MKLALATAMLAATTCTTSAATLFTCHDEKRTAIGRWMVEDDTFLVDREARVLKGYNVDVRVLNPSRKAMVHYSMVLKAGQLTIAAQAPPEFIAKMTLKPGTYRHEDPWRFNLENGLVHIGSRAIDIRSGFSKDNGFDRITKCSMSEQGA